jgi:hypothetical protein
MIKASAEKKKMVVMVKAYKMLWENNDELL